MPAVFLSFWLTATAVRSASLICTKSGTWLLTIFVYTDIIDYQLVGDSYSQLLQTVITTDKNYASIVSTKFDNPHYVPVNKSMITSINIDLRDDLGNKILFQNGKTIAKLHFRPKRYGF